MPLTRVYKPPSPSDPKINDHADVSVTIPAALGNRLRYDIIVTRRHVFAGALRAPARVDDARTIVVRFYNDEIATLAAGERGVFVPAARPAETVAVHASADPPIPWDVSTADIRFLRDDLAAEERPLRRAEVGWVRLAARPRQLLVAPEEALVTSPTLGPSLVGVTANNRTYTLLPVRIGKTIDGLVTIVSGVADQQRILGRDVFFLDAERRLHGGPAVEPRSGGER
jgi:hypothetical protein